MASLQLHAENVSNIMKKIEILQSIVNIFASGSNLQSNLNQLFWKGDILDCGTYIHSLYIARRSTLNILPNCDSLKGHTSNGVYL